jgi:hypothetical protein
MEKSDGHAVYLGSQCIDLLCCSLSHDGLILPNRQQMTELSQAQGGESKEYFKSIAASTESRRGATESLVELMQWLTKQEGKLSNTTRYGKTDSVLHKSYKGLVSRLQVVYDSYSLCSFCVTFHALTRVSYLKGDARQRYSS